MTEHDDTYEEDKASIRFWQRAMMGGSLALIVVWWAFVSFDATGGQAWIEKPSTWAETGDAFGAVTALFTAWAFVLMWSSLRLQALELEAQREDLRVTREQHAAELAEHRKAIEQQNAVQAEATRLDKVRLELDIINVGVDAMQAIGGAIQAESKRAKVVEEMAHRIAPVRRAPPSFLMNDASTWNNLHREGIAIMDMLLKLRKRMDS